MYIYIYIYIHTRTHTHTITGASGLYLSMRLQISKLGDIIYLAEQAPGFGLLGDCTNGETVIREPGTANATAVCVRGVKRERDILSVTFEQELPTPDLNPTYISLVKFVVGKTPGNASPGFRDDKKPGFLYSIGSVWARFMGDTGAGDHGNLAGLSVDGERIYMAVTYTRGVRNMSLQNCTFGVTPTECLVGGSRYTLPHRRLPGASSCPFQRNIARAPNQV